MPLLHTLRHCRQDVSLPKPTCDRRHTAATLPLGIRVSPRFSRDSTAFLVICHPSAALNLHLTALPTNAVRTLVVTRNVHFSDLNDDFPLLHSITVYLDQAVYHELPIDPSTAVTPQPDQVTFYISTLVHGDNVLYCYHRSAPGSSIKPGAARAGSPVKSRLLSKAEGVRWHDCVDRDGTKVPLEVIAEMLRAAGVGAEEWERRGVEVGDDAWAVYEGWRRKL